MEPTTITEQAQGLALVLAAAHRMGLPEPISVDIFATVRLQLYGMDAYEQWRGWADAEDMASEPHEVRDRWQVRHEAEGSIYDLPVHLVAIESGVMVPAEHYECEKCGAAFGTTAGFVPRGEYDDAFETEVARHMDGACFGVGVRA